MTQGVDQDAQTLFDGHFTSGNSLARQGRFDEASLHYEIALKLNRYHSETHNNLGNIRKEQGNLEAAVACYREALALKPDFFMAHNNLGVVLRDLRQLEEAVLHYRKALSLHPDYVEAYYNLGNVFLDQKNFEEAERCYRKALSLKSDHAESYMNLGNVLRHKEAWQEAIECYHRATLINPNYAEAHHNLGNILLEQGRFEEAASCHLRAISLKADYAEAYINLGNAMVCLDRTNDAIASYQHIIRMKPDYAEAHVNEAFARLRAGDFKTGWLKYEWRWKTEGLKHQMTRGPLWRGENLEGKSILLHCEQGFGDSLQFIRYARMVKEKGATVFLLCPSALQRLFSDVAEIDLLTTDELDLPSYDYHAPLLSLPLLFETTLETIPSKVPYLSAQQDLVDVWAKRLSSYAGLKVGIVWAGNPRIDQPHAYAVDRRRSMHLDQFAPLANLPGIQFFSLQMGEPAKQAKKPPHRLVLVDFMDEIKDFSDTAALIANLDLVLGVDTSVIHLAGAMGKPVWLLSRFDGCWRWLSQRDDSPWYPSLRLFRQPRMGDWVPVVEKIGKALSQLTQKS